MKQLSYIIIISLFAGLSSCKKFLDVKPEDNVQGDNLFSTEAGFQTNLNGAYLALTNTTMYGGQLTMEMLEVLAQRYNCLGSNPTSSYYELASYDYTSTKVTSKLTYAWYHLYQSIANINTMLEKADEHRDVFNANNYELVRGEGLGLRAFLHFDLLRMFGSVYKNDSTFSKRIPYYTRKTTVPGELLTGKEVVEKVLADLKEAEELLKVDPIITSGKGGSGPTSFTTARHLRFNYYAVKLLQARVYLYANRKEEALAAAKAVIEKQAAWFPFVTAGEVNKSSNPDRIFSNELVFALQDINVTTKFNTYFNSNQLDTLILAPVQTKLDKVYEASTVDYRYLSYTWAIPSDGTKSFKCFFKYAPSGDTAVRKYSIPMLRVTEAYLIAAEASTLTTDKFQYLNTVRQARNLLPLATTVNFTTELTKEYQKEFFGEGQLFFYYKRNYTTSVENGTATGNITMNNDKYVLPLPDAETSSRN